MFKQISAVAIAAALAVPAMAQDSTTSQSDMSMQSGSGTNDGEAGFNGLYVGGSFGGGFQSNDGARSSILFDRDLNGSFGDTLTTGAGANAFAPGFCGGRAIGNSVANGCVGDRDGLEYMGRVGFDIQRAGTPIVFGIVGEFGRTEVRDFVTAFSSTPASYTLARDLKYNANLRARLGFTPNNSTLFYATGGGAYGRVRNYNLTTNGVNSFTTNGEQNAYGYTAGGGVEQKIGSNFSVGLEYLYTDLYDNKSRVRVGPGTAPATSPFLLGNASGTDFRRSDPHFRWHSIRVTAAFRF